LIFFVLLASPSVAHSIASAAYRIGLPLVTSTRDDLRGKMDQGNDKDA